MSFVVTLHSFYGSAVEAAEPLKVIGRESEEEARRLAAELNAAISKTGEEYLAVVSQVEELDTAAALAFLEEF